MDLVLTPWSKVLSQTLTVTQPVKKFPAFNGTPMCITVSKQPATGPYSEPGESSSRSHTIYPP